MSHQVPYDIDSVGKVCPTCRDFEYGEQATSIDTIAVNLGGHSWVAH